MAFTVKTSISRLELENIRIIQVMFGDKAIHLLDINEGAIY